MLKFKHAILATLVIPVLAMAAAGCNDDADSSSSASQESIDTTNTRVQRNEMIWANVELEQLPLHDMDEALNDSSVDVPSEAIPTYRSVVRLISVTNWDDTLKADADKLGEDAQAALDALENDDRATAAEHATAVHEGAHDFTDKAWDHLAPGVAPEPASGGEEETTPAAGATSTSHGTPAASATP